MNGELWALLSALCYSLGNVTLRRGQQGRPFDSGIFVTTALGLAVTGALTLWEALHGRLPTITLAGLGWLLGQGLITAYGARTLYFRTIRRLGPSRASLFKAVAPVFTLMVSVPFLGERFSPTQAVGIAAMLAALWLLARDAARLEAEKPAPVAGGSQLARARRASIRLPAGWLMGICCSVGFGAGYLLRKLAVTAVPSPIFATFVSSLVAMGAIVAMEGRAPQFGRIVRDGLTGRSGPWMYVSACCATAALFSSFSAFTRTAAAMGAFLQSTQPLMTACLSLLLIGRAERLRPITVAALLLGTLGTTLLAL